MAAAPNGDRPPDPGRLDRLRALLPDLLVAAAAVVAGALLLPPVEAGFAAVLAVLVAVIAGVDRRVFLIPDTANLALAVVGLGFAVRGLPVADWAAPLGDAVARGLLAGLLFWGLRALHRLWRGVEGLGLGDVKLAAAGAPWLDWTSLVPVLELAVGAALVVVAAEALRRREGPRLDDRLPFGVFLAPALWLGFVAERTVLLDRMWLAAAG